MLVWEKLHDILVTFKYLRVTNISCSFLTLLGILNKSSLYLEKPLSERLSHVSDGFMPTILPLEAPTWGPQVGPTAL